MYIDQDSLGNDVEMFADNVPNCDNCSLAMGLPETTTIASQEYLSEIPEKSDEDINIPEVATGINIIEGDTELLIGEVFKFGLDVVPNNANIPIVTWESSDVSIAYVDQEGTVVAVKEGSVDIIATNSKDNKITSKVKVTVVSEPTPPPVEDVKVTKITLSENTKSINEGEIFTLTVTIEPEEATNKEVTWSSNSEHATVDETSGLVTAVSEGEAIITATAKDESGVTGSCTVTVNPAAIQLKAKKK